MISRDILENNLSTYSRLTGKHPELKTISDPAPLHEIKKFEKAAKVNISVWTHEEGKVYCIRPNKTMFQKDIDLIIIDDASNPKLSHWCAITSLSSLLALSKSRACTSFLQVITCYKTIHKP